MATRTRFYVEKPVEAIRDLFNQLTATDKVYIGIDPGKEGAIAFVPSSKKIEPVIFDMPVITHTVRRQRQKRGKRAGQMVDVTRTDYAIDEIRQWFEPVVDHVDRVVVVLEKSMPMSKGGRTDSAKTAFAIGMGYGMWPSIFVFLGFTWYEYVPSTWKVAMGLSKKSKDDSRQLASRLYPRASKYLTAKGDHNRAEALLIAAYQIQKDRTPL